jgi:ATP-dependent RNA helicase RhlE
MNQGHVKFDRLEVLVLDEADRMLDMGFIHDVRRIIATLPTRRQTLFFSATMPPDIQELADRILDNPVTVVVTPIASTVDTIAQSVFFVEKPNKPLLLEHLLRDKAIRRVLVFTRTKHGANKVVKQLASASIVAEAIHGNKSQSAREQALAHFKAGTTRVLVATDIAARGIDVDDITHVINYDLPNEPESYVHRIGRTGRAGMSGIALSFCDVEERAYLVDIERLIRKHVPRVANYPYASNVPQPALTDLTPRNQRANQPANRPQGSRPQNQQNRSPRPNRPNNPNRQGAQMGQNGQGGANSTNNPSNSNRRQPDRSRRAV